MSVRTFSVVHKMKIEPLVPLAKPLGHPLPSIMLVINPELSDASSMVARRGLLLRPMSSRRVLLAQPSRRGVRAALYCFIGSRAPAARPAESSR